MARSKQVARKSPAAAAAAERATVARSCPRMTAEKPVKKARRWSAGVVALREIKKYQKTTKLLLRKAPFQRMCRKVLKDVTEDAAFSISTGRVIPKSDVDRFTAQAFEALQYVAEGYLVEMFEEANWFAAHAKRKTLMVKDWQLVRKLREKEWKFPPQAGGPADKKKK